MPDGELVPSGPDAAKPEESLAKHAEGESRRSHARFALAALSSIPWIGGVMSAIAARDAEKDQGRVNELQQQWLSGLEEKVKLLQTALAEIFRRLDDVKDPDIERRIESEEYLDVVRKGFRAWDRSDTKEKRKIIQDLLTNAAVTRFVSDDVLRLFIDWIEKYHEIHFAVIREVFKNPYSTRAQIWDAISPGNQPRDDSAEADLFKLLVEDLSKGHVIHQDRDVNHRGEYLAKQRGTARRETFGRKVLKSAFDDKDEYVLTELGKQFVHYCMNEVVPRVGDPTTAEAPPRE